MERSDYIRIAMRYDTVMSRALLRALGVEPTLRRKGATAARMDRYADAAELMAQTHGVIL